eukprot:GHRR01000935.1.p1 GENE.GHRR01000935.1~~GHRR01000935.1.p1  ORF type:complete len:278 (+),score=102.89 GHRR01000935.1:170-1003(+)
MQLFVKCLDGRCSSLCLEGNSGVSRLKSHVQALSGVPVTEQVLVANGRLLNDAQTLAQSGLQSDSTVQLLLRLRGGKGGFGALLRGQGRDGKITDNFDACRDLSGRRIRHVEAGKKLQEWQQDAKERELEKLAMKHMKEMAKQAKRDRDYQINVEEVKRQHKEAAEAVAEAVQTALAEGLQQQKPGVGRKSSGPSSSGSKQAESGTDSPVSNTTIAAAAAAHDGTAADNTTASGSKRKGPAGPVTSNSPQKKRKLTMLDMLEGDSSDSDSDDSEDEA